MAAHHQAHDKLPQSEQEQLGNGGAFTRRVEGFDGR